MFQLKSRASLGAAVLLAASLLEASAVAQNSPVGTTWDCAIDGPPGVGLAYLTFNDDNTVTGISIVRPNFPAPLQVASTSTTSRYSGSAPDRGGTNTTDSGTVVIGSTTNVFGLNLVDGQWGYDPTGRIVGSFSQTISMGTNVYSTNIISFKAIVVPGVRLTLAAYTANGKAMYRGVAMRTLPDLSGRWISAQSGNNQLIYEFFELVPWWQQYGAYTLSGTGPNYTTDGIMMLSAWGRVGTAVLAGDNLRATVGTFRTSTSKAVTRGLIEPGKWINYNCYHYPQ